MTEDRGHGELERAHQELAKAELERDVDTMERIIHERFLGVDASGELLDKDHVLDTYGGGSLVLQTLLVEDREVRILGTTGVVSAFATMRGRTPRGEFRDRVRFTDVWVREEGRWRLFASHTTRVHGEIAGFGGGAAPAPEDTRPEWERGDTFRLGIDPDDHHRRPGFG